MSDLMLFGVLRMPFDMAMDGEIARRQFYDRAQEAADRIEALENELRRVKLDLEDARKDAGRYHFLRGKAYPSVCGGFLSFDFAPRIEKPEEMDAAIDAAMNKEEATGGKK